MRVVAVLLLVFQAFGTAAVPVLDGALSHVAEVVVHFEDAGQQDCPVSHHAADCGVCQMVQHGRALPAARTELPVIVAALGERPAARDVAAAGSADARANGSRAPPTA